MTAVIVADSSPLIALLNIGRFELLQRVFQQVIVPEKVAEEVERGEETNSVWFQYRQDGFIVVETLPDDERLPILRLQLDPGESEAILLADRMQLPLLMDERAGRSMAKAMGLSVRGLVGVLYALRKNDVLSVDDLREIVDALQRVNFRMSDALRALLLD